MKKNLLLLLACISPIFVMHAQDPEVSWGPISKAGSNDAGYIPLGWDEGHYYAVQLDGKSGYLMNVNETYSLESQVELITGENKFDADLIFLRGGKIHILSSEYEGGENTNYVRVTSFTTQGRTTNIKLKKIASIQVEKNSEHTFVNYVFSRDSSLLLMYEEHEMKKGDYAKVTITVIKTDGFTELWSVSTELPFEDKDLKIITGALENNGGVMLLASYEGDDGKRLAKYSNVVFSFNTDGKFNEKVVKMEGKYISSATIRFVNDEKAFITGFYNTLTTKGRSEGIEGAFIGVGSPDNIEAMEFHHTVLDSKIKAAIVPSEKRDDLEAYVINDLKINEDGSGYAIAEQRIIYEVRDMNNPNVVRARTYYFNHLIVYRFDSDLNISSFACIPKQQATTVHPINIGLGPLMFTYWPGSTIRKAYKYNSFISLEKDGNIYILYNDHADNGDARTLKETKTMTNKNKAMATLVTVDAEGGWVKEQLFRGKDLEVIFETSSSYISTGKGFIISAERGKNLQYGSLEL